MEDRDICTDHHSVGSFSYSFSEEVSVEGEVGIKGVYAGVTGGEGGRAKFTEYRDLKTRR